MGGTPASTASSALLVLVAATGCTVLGPVPGMTAVNAVPAPAADVELQAGIVPGYYLSDAVQPDQHGGGTAQASLMLEPDELIHVNGLSVGARGVAGGSDDGYFEPMLRYRRWLDSSHYLALAAVGYATHASESRSGASYSMTHGGGEVGFDLGVDHSPWVELHLQAGGSVSGLTASGKYCSDDVDGWGTDCPDGKVGDVYGHVDGAFPTIFGGFSLDFGRHLGAFHGVRLAMLGAAGQMPLLQQGNQRSKRGWSSAGVSLTVAFGAASDATD